jgi:hypothetical protein
MTITDHSDENKTIHLSAAEVEGILRERVACALPELEGAFVLAAAEPLREQTFIATAITWDGIPGRCIELEPALPHAA